MVVLGADDVDFIKEGLVIAGNDSVAVIFKINGDKLFGTSAYVGGVLLGFVCWCEFKKGFTWFERFAVLWGEAVFVNGCDVGFGAVADVLVETIFGVFFGKRYHIIVTGDFSDDGSGGDFANLVVTFDAGGSMFF